jgi:hypothetical protein
MRMKTILAAAVTLSVAAMLASGPALAQKKAAKKLTYDEAWSVCKKYVDEGVKSWDQTSQRYSRGASCMKKYGYKI